MDQAAASLVFEGHAPDGRAFRVFSDGSAEGFPDGLVVVNHFLRRHHLAQALLKKCVDAQLVTNDEAARLLS